MRLQRLVLCVAGATVIALLAACNSGSSGVSFNPFPPGSQLYAAISGPPKIAVFTSPFSATTTPSGSITSGVGQPGGVATDPTDPTGQVYVATGFPAGGVAVYARPSPSGGSPLFTITGGGMTSTQGMAFDAAGNLYVADPNSNKVFLISKPISGASTPAPLGLTAAGSPFCVALDRAGNLYEVDFGTNPNTLRMYGPSHSGAQIASTTTGMTSLSNRCGIDPITQRIFVASVTSAGPVIGFATPLTNGAGPVVTLTPFPSGIPVGVGFDPTGTLYVGSLAGSASTIVLYTQPISSASTPVVTFNSTGAANQLATGP